MNRVVRGGETRKRSTCKVSHTFQERNEFVGVGGKYFCLVSLSVDKGKKFILFRVCIEGKECSGWQNVARN